jgi:DNA-binding Lrp family transcriptional regulator
MTASLDQIDKKILVLLQENARYTIKEMAAKMNLSTTPIFERMKRLEKEGVIDKYVALVNPKKIGKNLFAYVHISLKAHGNNEVENFVSQVIEFEEVMECCHIAGDSDFILKIALKDIEEYNQFVLNKLSNVGNVGKIDSRFCLSIRKYSTSLSIDFD